MMAWLKGVLGFFSFASGLLDMMKGKQQREAGQLQQQNADLKENAEAGRRVQEAQASPRGREVTQDALDSGRF